MNTQAEKDYSNFIFKTKYAHWIPTLKRRETWEEAVERYFNFMQEHLYSKYGYDNKSLRELIEPMVNNLEVMPSMRALMSAGYNMDKNHISAYNCSFLIIDSINKFSEVFLILSYGCGVGYSVEKKFIQNLPQVPEVIFDVVNISKVDNKGSSLTKSNYQVEDSKEGWAKAIHYLITCLFSGYNPEFDFSSIRPRGTRLKSSGGFAPGSEPLQKALNSISSLIRKSCGRKLTSVEVSDIVLLISQAISSGGMRRSACICLCDLEDDDMRYYKTQENINKYPFRTNANISAVYEEKPPEDKFWKEWCALRDSGTGERGIFNRESCRQICESIGRNICDSNCKECRCIDCYSNCECNCSSTDKGHDVGTNPCSEIILRPNQFCNLTEVVIRSDDNERSLKKKVWAATILGTWQSTLTKFPNIDNDWKNNTESERLLGVSLTGICDNKLTYDNDKNLVRLLTNLRSHARNTNSSEADKIGIQKSASITCVKPSGSVSQLVNCASGIHPRFDNYYLRAVTLPKQDPIAKYLVNTGIYYEDHEIVEGCYLFYFPIGLGNETKNSLTRDDIDPISHLELWKTYQNYWCDHKPSITVNVRDNEWDIVGRWVYNNFDIVSGISFFPFLNTYFKQAPFQTVSEERFNELLNNHPKIEWENIVELNDDTEPTTMVCTPEGCE